MENKLGDDRPVRKIRVCKCYLLPFYFLKRPEPKLEWDRVHKFLFDKCLNQTAPLESIAEGLSNSRFIHGTSSTDPR